jgi:lipopolysaccharide export system protein LptC
MSAIGEGARVARQGLAMIRLQFVGSAALSRDPYSRRVSLLKRVLPASGLTLLLLITAWPQLSPILERVRFAVPPIDLREARELRMINPRYAGLDRLGRPYVMTAAIGRQVPNRDDLIAFEKPHGDLRLNSGMHVVVTSVTGVYQSPAQLLDLFDDVNMVRDDGTHFVTGSAHLDLATNTGEGKDPIVGHGPSGDITAQGFRILNSGDTIIFTGASDAVLKATRHNAKPAEPPSPPLEVDEIAAEVEAAAPALLVESVAPRTALPGPAAKPAATAAVAKRTGAPAAVRPAVEKAPR